MIRQPVAAFRAAAIGLALGLAAPAAADPIVQSVESHRNDQGEIDRTGGGLVHRATGYVFPLTLADMPAVNTITYAPGIASVAYGFDTKDGRVFLALFIYPAEIPLAEDAANVEEALLQNMPGKAIDRPAAAPPPPAAARERWFDSTVGKTEVVTGYRIVQDGKHMIKVRLTMPKAGGQATLDRGWRALAAVRWSIAPPAASGAASAASE